MIQVYTGQLEERWVKESDYLHEITILKAEAKAAVGLLLDAQQECIRLRNLLQELVAHHTELVCDDCGRNVSKLCPPTCIVRRAREALGQPHEHYTSA